MYCIGRCTTRIREESKKNKQTTSFRCPSALFSAPAIRSKFGAPGFFSNSDIRNATLPLEGIGKFGALPKRTPPRFT